MAFRGYFTLRDFELVNSSRTIAHMGGEVPTTDIGIFAPTTGLCGLEETAPDSGLYVIPDDSVEVRPGLWSPPNGSKMVGHAMFTVNEDCWGSQAPCGNCSSSITYDDSWTGLKAYLDDMIYRVELAPWYSADIPESGEFIGIWLLDVQGLDTMDIERSVTEMIGPGGGAGPHRDKSRTISFDALLFGCTNAGLKYGLNWLSCRLRETVEDTNASLKFFTAHPEHTAAPAASLAREVHQVVQTKGIEIKDSHVGSGQNNLQALIHRVDWSLTALNPYVYLPPIKVDVDWDTIDLQQIDWVHAADCARPTDCREMPVLFSTECQVETINVVTLPPPPSCGGCMPVCELEEYVFQVPTFATPYRCRDTAVSMEIRNDNSFPLSAQFHWRKCTSDNPCDDERFPLQIAGLKPIATIVMDAVNRRYWGLYDGIKHRPRGIVGTPSGAPWRPPVINRQDCWELVATAPVGSEFTVTLRMHDREA